MLTKKISGKANAVWPPVVVEISSEVVLGRDELLLTKGPNTPECIAVNSFHSLVGSLIWIAYSRCPDIAHKVHHVTRKAHKSIQNDV